MLNNIKQSIFKHLKTDKPKYPLKFYRNTSGRYGVSYNNTHICTCSEEQMMEVQEHFDNGYDGNNLTIISDELKLKYNEKIKKNRTSHKRRRRKGRTFRDSKLQFEQKPTGRLQVRVNDNGRVHTICQCYPNQKDSVVSDFNSLKKFYDLEMVKHKMKMEYNLRGKGKVNDVKHIISVDNDGTIYKDGKYIKVNKRIYELVNGLLEG